ncbi:arylsulfotransferase family protein [Streptococcus merionis]
MRRYYKRLRYKVLRFYYRIVFRNEYFPPGRHKNREPAKDERTTYTVMGETDLKGHFLLSFIFSRNLLVLDGKGRTIWSKYEPQPQKDFRTGFWDFKRHDFPDGTYLYSYHDFTGTYDSYRTEGYFPGERVLLTPDFEEIDRLTIIGTEKIEDKHPLDSHDFLFIEKNHYIQMAYRKTWTKQVPNEERGCYVLAAYIQEVRNGIVIWEWDSSDYVEFYNIMFPAEDVDAWKSGVIDYLHLNSMLLGENGELLLSFRNLSSIVCIDRTGDGGILWQLSGRGDQFKLPYQYQLSAQHDLTWDDKGRLLVFNNGVSMGNSAITAYHLDIPNKQVKSVQIYAIPGYLSVAAGSGSHIVDDIYIFGWGKSKYHDEAMSVVDFGTGETLLSIIPSDSRNISYRAFYAPPEVNTSLGNKDEDSI